MPVVLIAQAMRALLLVTLLTAPVAYTLASARDSYALAARVLVGEASWTRETYEQLITLYAREQRCTLPLPEALVPADIAWLTQHGYSVCEGSYAAGRRGAIIDWCGAERASRQCHATGGVFYEPPPRSAAAEL